ncbi:hypothetical protein LV178_24065, partial [Burkholderia mallei]|nr:hypothetical protein [Burkholderia mallei]
MRSGDAAGRVNSVRGRGAFHGVRALRRRNRSDLRYSNGDASDFLQNRASRFYAAKRRRARRKPGRGGCGG